MTADPLVFLPGFLCDARLFWHQILDFSADRTVIAAPLLGASVEEMAETVLATLPPRFSLVIHDWQYLLTFAVMLIVGLIVGQLTARFRYQAQVASAREERARYLYEMSRELSGALAAEQVIEISERCVEASFRVKARLLRRREKATNCITAKAKNAPSVIRASEGMKASQVMASSCLSVGERRGSMSSPSM